MLRHFTGNFENEIPESDSGTGNDYFGFADNKKKKKKINPNRPTLDFFDMSQ